jgi:hypothetical protein
VPFFASIEIMGVAENGILEVAKNRYSKYYCFQDINYTTTNEDDTAIKTIEDEEIEKCFLEIT